MHWYYALAGMGRQSLPSCDISDSDHVTPWKQKNCGERKACVSVCILMSMFSNFHLFWSMRTFLVRDINILTPWLINLPIYMMMMMMYLFITVPHPHEHRQLQELLGNHICTVGPVIIEFR